MLLMPMSMATLARIMITSQTMARMIHLQVTTPNPLSLLPQEAKDLLSKTSLQ